MHPGQSEFSCHWIRSKYTVYHSDTLDLYVPSHLYDTSQVVLQQDILDVCRVVRCLWQRYTVYVAETGSLLHPKIFNINILT